MHHVERGDVGQIRMLTLFLSLQIIILTRGDRSEQCVNLLFDDRAREAIVQEASLQSVMQKKEQPDRIYGLRMTKWLERLLQWT
jgi:hypothetical protein